MNSQEEMISKINDLLTMNYDAEARYNLAAEKVENLPLREFLQDRALNRYDFGHALKEEIRALGGEPEKGTSLKGDLHKAWMTFKDAISSGDKSIYEECVRGEKAYIKEYEEVLAEKEVIPPTTEALIKEQLAKSKVALRAVEALEDFSDSLQ